MNHRQKGRGAVATSIRVLLATAMIGAVLGVFAPSNASTRFDWEGQGWPNATCQTNPQTALWVFTGKGVTNVVFHWDSTEAAMTQQGGGAWHVTVPFFDPTVAANEPIYVTYDGTLSNSNATLTLSGCNEGGVQTASLTVLKSIPNVLQGSETVTFTFQALLNNVVEGSCTITFTAGETNDQCTITGLQPNTTYTIHEVAQAPWATQPDQTVTTGDAGSNTAEVTFENTFGPATARACKVTDVDNTGHDASGDSFEFKLYADGVAVETVTVAGGGTANDPVCTSFSTALVENVKYTIAETSWPTGYSKVSLVCKVGNTTVTDFTPDYPGDADALFKCTATDSITAAHVTVRKVTIPAGSEAGFTFHLFADGVDTGATATSTGTGALPFTPNVALQDGVHYTITEDPKQEWESNGGVGCDFTVHYPADSGKTFTCVFTNTHVSKGLTIGYWKQHLANSNSRGPWYGGTLCRSGLPTGTGCSTNGPWTIQYLPISLNGYSVDSILKAAQVFAANNCGVAGDKNAVNCLAAQLLAAKLNVANGASHCADGVIADADAFLTSISYNGPLVNYTLTADQRVTAVNLKTALDMYNNGTCPV